MHTKRLKRKTIYKICLGLLLLCLLALHFDAIFIRDLNLKFNGEISIEGIFSVLVTILLALYIAYVVEAGREQKQSQNSILEYIWQASYDATKDLADKLELPRANYLYMTAWPKRMNSFLENAKRILIDKDLLTDIIINQLKQIGGDIQELRKLVTTTTSKKDSQDNYLEVKKNQITAIAPQRQEQAMLLISQIQSEILSIWTDTLAG